MVEAHTIKGKRPGEEFLGASHEKPKRNIATSRGAVPRALSLHEVPCTFEVFLHSQTLLLAFSSQTSPRHFPLRVLQWQSDVQGPNPTSQVFPGEPAVQIQTSTNALKFCIHPRQATVPGLLYLHME